MERTYCVVRFPLILRDFPSQQSGVGSVLVSGNLLYPVKVKSSPNWLLGKGLRSGL